LFKNTVPSCGASLAKMNTYQTRTYLVYSRGLSPEDLTLGSLYLDPANPLDGEHKRFECPLRQPDLHKWAGDPECDESCVLTFTASRQWLINSGLFGLLKGRAGRRGSEEVSVSGKAGRRLRIKTPEKFLNEVLLASPSARAWLTTQLSISRVIYYVNRAGLSKPPRIWMVTGIQYIIDANVVNNRSQHQVVSASANIPVPEPVSAAVAILGGQEGLSGGFVVDSSSRMKMSYHHEDERVWAAQFTQLAVKFTPKPESIDDLPNRIPLRDVVDLKSAGVRAGSQPPDFTLTEEFAEICGLEEDNTPQSSGEDLVKRMQDVDWGMLNKYLAETRHDMPG